MKKILIITEVFPPAFNPRMGYLVKYLSEFGWDADIITNNTVKENNYSSLVGRNRIIRVELKHTDIPIGIIKKIWRLLNLKRHFFNSRKPFIKELKSNFKKEDYTVILVSVAWKDLFVLDAGFVISKKWNIPLIVDLRDIQEQKPVMEYNNSNLKNILLKFIYKSLDKRKFKLRNKILKQAQAVTTVSPFHVEKLLRFNAYIKLIYNGYDPDIYYLQNHEITDTFTILYTGLIMDEKEQDPTLLFEAVRQLEKDKVIDRKYFRIQFYSPINFRSAIINHRMFPLVEKYIDFFEYVNYEEVPKLLQKSSIALVLSNLSNCNGPKGVLTTKYFEYLGAERPVLCVRSDEDILEHSIIKANIGIAARTNEDAYNFILKKWKEWKEKGYTTTNVNQIYKQQFTRNEQARQFVELFEEISMNQHAT